MTDWDLLNAFLTNASPEAFEALVGRYLPLVYTHAYRQVKNHHLAEDITQAVFAILARRAPRLHKNTILAGWLFQTTRYASANALKMNRRRHHHETQSSRLRPLQTDLDENPSEDLLHLDQALAKLSRRDRDLLLLRYFRQFSMQQIAATLTISEAAAKKRTTRALHRLHQILLAQNETTTLSSVATLLTITTLGSNVTAESITTGALATAKGAASTTTGLIMKGALKMMFWHKLKLAAVIAAVSLTITGAATLPHLLAQQTPPPAPMPTAAAPTPLSDRDKLNNLRKLANDLSKAADEYRTSRDLPAYRDEILAEIVKVTQQDSELRKLQRDTFVAQSDLANALKTLGPKSAEVATLKTKLDQQRIQEQDATEVHDELAHRLQDRESAFLQYERMTQRIQALDNAANELEIQIALK